MREYILHMGPCRRRSCKAFKTVRWNTISFVICQLPAAGWDRLFVDWTIKHLRPCRVFWSMMCSSTFRPSSPFVQCRIFVPAQDTMFWIYRCSHAHFWQWLLDSNEEKGSVSTRRQEEAGMRRLLVAPFRYFLTSLGQQLVNKLHKSLPLHEDYSI